MNREGWISIHRAIQDNWIWKDSNKLKWWLDILLTVNTNTAKVNIGNDIYDCKRGESLLSIQSWSNRWGVSKDTARNFLNLLEKDNMIVRVNLGKTTRLTVCKYDSYQQPLRVKQTAAVQTLYTNNKEDNENNNIPVKKLTDINYNPFKDFFIDFYKHKFSTDYYFQPKDGVKVNALIKKIATKVKEKHNGKSNEQIDKLILSGLKTFIDKIYIAQDKYLIENFSLSYIDSHFNELFIKITNPIVIKIPTVHTERPKPIDHANR